MTVLQLLKLPGTDRMWATLAHACLAQVKQDSTHTKLETVISMHNQRLPAYSLLPMPYFNALPLATLSLSRLSDRCNRWHTSVYQLVHYALRVKLRENYLKGYPKQNTSLSNNTVFIAPHLHGGGNTDVE